MFYFGGDGFLRWCKNMEICVIVRNLFLKQVSYSGFLVKKKSRMNMGRFLFRSYFKRQGEPMSNDLGEGVGGRECQCYLKQLLNNRFRF